MEISYYPFELEFTKAAMDATIVHLRVSLETEISPSKFAILLNYV